MSAAELRQAAALMRERAAQAEATETWDWRAKTGETYWPQETRAGRYIQSWHPAVALAVADLLDRAADDHDDTPCPAIDEALAVARAYLGSAS